MSRIIVCYVTLHDQVLTFKQAGLVYAQIMARSSQKTDNYTTLTLYDYHFGDSYCKLHD